MRAAAWRRWREGRSFCQDLMGGGAAPSEVGTSVEGSLELELGCRPGGWVRGQEVELEAAGRKSPRREGWTLSSGRAQRTAPAAVWRWVWWWPVGRIAASAGAEGG